LVFWNFFSGSLSHASNSLTENESIIKKVYFPKLILPISSIVTGIIDFSINFLLLVGYTLLLGIIPSWTFIPVVLLGILITSISASGLGLFLSSVNVKYRDVRYILPFFIQILMFVSPVIYPTAIVRTSNKFLLALNPITAVIETVRSTISPSGVFDWPLIIVSSISAIAIFVFGLTFFRYTEKYLADIV